MYSVTSFLSRSFTIDCLLELYKLSFILWFVYFSDVLIFSLKNKSIISLYEVFKVHCYEHLDGNECNEVSVLRAMHVDSLTKTSHL